MTQQTIPLHNSFSSIKVLKSNHSRDISLDYVRYTQEVIEIEFVSISMFSTGITEMLITNPASLAFHPIWVEDQ
jgi:hypothetical protein